ncbi:hypothetical protein NEOLEDRAFT_1132920 [Neolentinus lepideus HHB14362 ss-1]|uniref:Uncharacterized protein n=1 Tax=Neolentinus lepideus HHB14362 ss-1 TaxID=1314782 RepID=A0A165SZ74_9AGAM|nr:hypothetical protein NEOLEDRAFT_1132920 [Neolentinus lepideus HHB14362 ss-1]
MLGKFVRYFNASTTAPNIRSFGYSSNDGVDLHIAIFLSINRNLFRTCLPHIERENISTKRRSQFLPKLIPLFPLSDILVGDLPPAFLRDDWIPVFCLDGLSRPAYLFPSHPPCIDTRRLSSQVPGVVDAFPPVLQQLAIQSWCVCTYGPMESHRIGIS